ncbi:MAG: hypothetical protein ACLUFW_10725 [Alistipes sp.]
MGLDYFAAGVYDLDRNPTVTLPAMDFAENPAFRYRQSQGYGMAQDSVYRLALRSWRSRATSLPAACGCTPSTKPASGVGLRRGASRILLVHQRRTSSRPRQPVVSLTNDELFELVDGESRFDLSGPTPA